MLMKNKLNLSIVLFSTFTALSANAGLVNQYTSTSTYQRDCPGLADQDTYLAKWQNVINWYYAPRDEVTNQIIHPMPKQPVQLACHFNGGPQQQHYNNDGTPKYGDWPVGAPFEDDEVGSAIITSDLGSNYASIGAPDGKYYSEIILDEENLGLPQIKLSSYSDANERNSVNGYAFTEFLWTGESETLEYQVDFDFFNSGGTWESGNPEIDNNYDYLLALGFGVATDVVLSDDSVFPEDWGNDIANAGFNSFNEPLIASGEETPYTGSLSVSFDVETGDSFFLYGWAQAFGFNGGYMDASHTLTSALAVIDQTTGLAKDDSAELLSASLRQAPPPPSTDVPEPSAFILTLIGLFGLATRMQLKRK